MAMVPSAVLWLLPSSLTEYAERLCAPVEYIAKILPMLLNGTKLTIGLWCVTMLFAMPLGFLVSSCVRSKVKPLAWLMEVYIYIMRGTPLMLQLMFVYYGLPYIPKLGPYLTMGRFTAASVAFVLNYAAYFAEIFRGGFLAVPKGQYEACQVLGMNKLQAMTRVIVPQMFRVALPSITNETITLAKAIVNANMNRLQYTTMAVITGIVGILAVTILLLVVQNNRQKLRKKDQQLLAREELFSNLSRNVDDVFLMIDTETSKVEYVSPNVQRILGISPEAVQEDFHVLYSAGDDNCAPQLENLMQMEQGVQQEWDRDFIHQETGESRYIHVTGFINDVQGAKKCIVDLSDRTGEHQTTLAVEAALEVAEKASKAKTDFLSNMSHDIRTPMNAIIGITTLMKNELHEPEKLAEHLGKLETSGQLLLGIINDILDMSRIESGKTTLNVEKMNLPQQVSQLDSVIRQQASQRRQTFTVNTLVQHENVLADPNRLNQVLMNILSNAVKYTPTGGYIRLDVDELTHTEHYAKYRFVVQDNGIGMSEEFQKTLFEPFTREEKSGTNKVQGTGLGMAITKSIVDLMGGSISVESATGKGTRFEVVLEFPIDAEADTAQKAQELPEETEDTSPLCGMKFLCAEDNALNAEILQMLLETKGASCTICSNGQEIVDAFVRVKPGEYDMILMDVQMPVMDGLEAARRIRSSENPLGQVIPILAMTANAFLEDMQKSKEAGMDEHLSKPVDIDALEQAVKRFRVTPPPPENK